MTGEKNEGEIRMRHYLPGLLLDHVQLDAELLQIAAGLWIGLRRPVCQVLHFFGSVPHFGPELADLVLLAHHPRWKGVGLGHNTSVVVECDGRGPSKRWRRSMTLLNGASSGSPGNMDRRVTVSLGAESSSPRLSPRTTGRKLGMFPDGSADAIVTGFGTLRPKSVSNRSCTDPWKTATSGATTRNAAMRKPRTPILCDRAIARSASFRTSARRRLLPAGRIPPLKSILFSIPPIREARIIPGARATPQCHSAESDHLTSPLILVVLRSDDRESGCVSRMLASVVPSIGWQLREKCVFTGNVPWAI